MCILLPMVADPAFCYRVALHNAMESALKALVLPRKASLEIHSKMGEQIVSLSDAVRDMRNEITFSALRPDDAEQLRNLLQSVIRHIMAIKPETSLFVREHAEGSKDVTIQIEPSVDVDGISMISSDYQNPLEVVRNVVAAPARELATAATEMLRCCNNELMRITGVDDLLDKREIFDVQIGRAHV